MIVNNEKCAYRAQAEYLIWMDLTLPEYMAEKGCGDCPGLEDSKDCFKNLESLIKQNENLQWDLD